RKGAMLEASKQFAKEFMARHGLPTAGFQVLYEAGYARQRIKENRKYPLVIKADGLAAGKGVRICADEGEALRAVEDLMEKRMFGYSGSKLVMEEHLTGREASVMALVDGNSYLMLPVSRDHKRLRDGNEGPNTGGMGAVAPVRLEDNVLETVRTEVLDRFIAGIKKDGIPFRGVIYAGIMLTPSGPKVLEFNVRLGDPETQCLLPLLDGDILELLSACAEGRLAGKKAGASGACASVVLSARGYPDAPEKGREISGLDDLPEGALVFHSGTRKADGKFVTCGGRVLAVSCRAATPEEAREKVYAAVKKIRFDGMHFRTDIGL
ncbi:MAG TPA: phosphoribosylamine--glycine ligase, partial [Elusimicrobiales bacterium]|nr:phosphoribosylamine--glycine ligase [Elusimicrobiales bacterium]